VKAIVSSGYSDDPVMANPEHFGFSGVLPKPYQPKELISLVRRLLNA
jgi:CheY-like chemotaxis protein